MYLTKIALPNILCYPNYESVLTIKSNILKFGCCITVFAKKLHLMRTSLSPLSVSLKAFWSLLQIIVKLRATHRCVTLIAAQISLLHAKHSNIIVVMMFTTLSVGELRKISKKDCRKLMAPKRVRWLRTSNTNLTDSNRHSTHHTINLSVKEAIALSMSLWRTQVLHRHRCCWVIIWHTKRYVQNTMNCKWLSIVLIRDFAWRTQSKQRELRDSTMICVWRSAGQSLICACKKSKQFLMRWMQIGVKMLSSTQPVSLQPKITSKLLVPMW